MGSFNCCNHACKQVILIEANDDEEMEFWESHNENIAQMAKGSPVGKAVALVCQNFACSAPVTDPKSLETLLKQGAHTGRP